jgi:uncharacterized damage-inducible protein DinB
MSTEIERIKDQMQKTFYSDAWHGGSVMEFLSEISAMEAASHPLKARHSIWELGPHMETWKRVARYALEGNEIGRISPEEDWPPIEDIGEEAWARTVESLREEHEALMGALSRLSEESIGETVPGRSYSFYTLLHGVIHHDLYHLGQIAVLKEKKE